jgi:hypothetical protein
LAIYDSWLFYVQGDIFGHSSSFSAAVSSPSARLSLSTPTAGAGAGGAGAGFSGKSRLHTVDDADFNLIDDEDSLSQSCTVGNSVAPTSSSSSSASSSSSSSSSHVYNQSPAIEFLMKAIDPALVQAMGGVSRSTKFE